MRQYRLYQIATTAFCMGLVSSCDKPAPKPQLQPQSEIETVVDSIENIAVDEVAQHEEVIEDSIEIIEKAFSKSDMGLRSFFEEYNIPYADVLAIDAAIKTIERAGFKANDMLTFSLKDDSVYQLNWYRDAKNIIEVTRQPDGSYIAENVAPRPIEKTFFVDATIETNFYAALKNDGMPEDVILEMARVLGFAIDFRTDIHVGNNFRGQLICQSYAPSDYYPDGAVEDCKTIYARAEIGYGTPSIEEVFQYKMEDDDVVYLDETGKAAADFLLKVPINGARLSSNFNPNRRHPISGYVRAHKGTDFAAPTGTPVYAAGDGVIERASRNGGYGNYVRIKHPGGYKTAYAHLSRFGTSAGRRVRQGDVIGYVGSTGASTGPHLHYEVWLNERAINSQTMKMPKIAKLEGAALEAYQSDYIVKVRADFSNGLAKKRWDSLQSWAGRGFNALTQGPS